jgi:hypothetical protein
MAGEVGVKPWPAPGPTTIAVRVVWHRRDGQGGENGLCIICTAPECDYQAAVVPRGAGFPFPCVVAHRHCLNQLGEVVS